MISTLTKNKILRIRSRIYISLLLFLSMFSISHLAGCVSRSSELEQQEKDDSLNKKLQYLEQQLQQKSDSLKAIRDAAALKDSAEKARTKKTNLTQPSPAKPTYVPSQPAVDYGVLYYETPSVKPDGQK